MSPFAFLTPSCLKRLAYACRCANNLCSGCSCDEIAIDFRASHIRRTKKSRGRRIASLMQWLQFRFDGRSTACQRSLRLQWRNPRYPQSRRSTYLLCPRPHSGALSDDARPTSVCLSRTSGLSREQSRKTKIGTEVAHVTRDSDTTFKVKRSKVNLQGRGHSVAASRTACLGRSAAAQNR